MADLADLYVSLTSQVSGFIAGMDTAIAKTQEFEAVQAEAKATALEGSMVGNVSGGIGAAGLAGGAGAAAKGEAAAAEEAAVAHRGAAVAAAEHRGALSNLMGLFPSFGSIAKTGAVAAAVAVGAVGFESIKAAGDFQQLTTQLVTGAGESRDQLEMVRQGLMAMAPQVGITADELAKGMYNIESAGFHGASGLDILKAAAQGAAVGGADMATVADGLTSAMNAYRGSGLSATQMTNDLVSTVASGKMHMQDLASSLGMVLPAASAAGVSLTDVSAAIATMTAQGTPAADAATYLRQTILMLENPSGKAQDALKGMGLTAKQVGESLREHGLSGTLQMITDKLGHEFPVGSQQYIAALADMVGGTKSMQAALELTGPNMKAFDGNVVAISAAVANGKTQVAGFSDVQGDLNFQMASAKAAVEDMAISIGDRLLPIASRLAYWFVHDGIPDLQQFGAWLDEHVQPILRRFGDWLHTTGLPLMERFKDWLEKVGPPILTIAGNLAGNLLNAAQKIGDYFEQHILPPFQKLVDVLLPPLLSLFQTLSANTWLVEAAVGALVALKAADWIKGVSDGLTGLSGSGVFDKLANKFKSIFLPNFTSADKAAAEGRAKEMCATQCASCTCGGLGGGLGGVAAAEGAAAGGVGAAEGAAAGAAAGKRGGALRSFPFLGAALYIASSFGTNDKGQVTYAPGIPFTDITLPPVVAYGSYGGDYKDGDMVTGSGGRAGKIATDPFGNKWIIYSDGSKELVSSAAAEGLRGTITGSPAPSFTIAGPGGSRVAYAPSQAAVTPSEAIQQSRNSESRIQGVIHDVSGDAQIVNSLFSGWQQSLDHSNPILDRIHHHLLDINGAGQKLVGDLSVSQRHLMDVNTSTTGLHGQMNAIDGSIQDTTGSTKRWHDHLMDVNGTTQAISQHMADMNLPVIDFYTRDIANAWFVIASNSSMAANAAQGLTTVPHSGVLHFAAGGLAKGWAVVGEKGPELAYFGGGGAMIYPHGTVPAAAATSTGAAIAGATVTVGQIVIQGVADAHEAALEVQKALLDLSVGSGVSLLSSPRRGNLG